MSEDDAPEPQRTIIRPVTPDANRDPTTPEDPPTRKLTAHAMIGAVLNHIYRVDRFIAAGGMGAVYEGINVISDERVAVKIILPHLAADKNIQELFRNEARTLTQLSHPGLVQYRVLAQEPNLGVFYIVTEFIDGPALSEVLAQLRPTAEQLRQLGIRLASGLAVAHELGKIHRDISPDNILLPSGRLDLAKIIDFGIAKDLNAINRTIVGRGFAGKLSCVAPEQFGDPRHVGPWTDIYSLGLVLLALALGKPPPMGTTISDAVAARQTVPDLSSVPPELRACVAHMLEPDPANRFRSMRDVVDALESLAPERQDVGPEPPVRERQWLPAGLTRPLQIGLGSAAAVAAIAAVAVIVWGIIAYPLPPIRKLAQPHLSTHIASVAELRGTLAATIRNAECSWLDLGDPSPTSGGFAAEISGVVGKAPGKDAAAVVAELLSGVKTKVDTRSVFAIDRSACSLLDTLRAFRNSSSPALRLVNSRLPLRSIGTGLCASNSLRQAEVDVAMDTGTEDFSLLGLDGKGGIQQLYASRAEFDSNRAADPRRARDLGNMVYRLSFCADENTMRASPDGLAGILILKGRGPFDLELARKTRDTQPVSQDWLDRFRREAASQGWTADMAWYQLLSE
jgi:eukaryotic-like serine/threonine-protein kinase